MVLKSVRLFAPVLVLAVLPALAEEPKKMEMPKLPAELSQLAYFAGTWSCTGKGFASPMGPEHVTEATVKASLAAGGRWYYMTYDEKKTAANPAPIHAAILMGYDTALKEFVQRCVDNTGGYCNQTGKGWNGDTMAFEGGVNGWGEKMQMRDTFMKKSATELVHTGEIQGPDGKWTKLDEETCKKAAKK